MSISSRIAATAVAVALGLGSLIAPAAAHAAPAAQQLAAASTINGQITRSEVLARAQFWVDQHVVYGTVYDGNGNVTSTRRYPDPQGTDYRTDCSGLVAMAWHISAPGADTDGFRTMANTRTIGADELQPGDAVLFSGHIEMFAGWKSGNHADGAYSYSLNGPVDHDWAKGPRPNWQGQTGTLSWNDISVAAVRLIHYNNLVDDPTMVTGGRSADFNQDGRSDILARTPDGVLWLYPGTGNATQDAVVSAPVRVGIGWGTMTGLTAGDFNHDGKGDIVARTPDGVLWLYPGTGNATQDAVVGAAVRIGTGWGAMTAITAGDFNHDGRSDLVVRDAAGNLSLYPGTGNATQDAVVSAPVRIGTGWGALPSITAGDFTGDGKDDLAVRSTDGTAMLYPGTGNAAQDAVVSPPVRIGTGWGTMTALTAGDFNHDSRSDLVGRNVDGSLALYPGTGSATQDAIVSAPPVRIGVGWQTMTALS